MTSRKPRFWPALAEHLSGGQGAFVALVADSSAHSPGTAGARMFVRPDGSTWGTVGGGGMEAAIIGRAADAGFRPETQTLVHRRDTDGEPSGLICAGEQTMVYAWVAPQTPAARVIAAVAERVEADSSGLLELVGVAAGTVDGDTWSLADEEPRPGVVPVRLVRDVGHWRYAEQLLSYKRAAIFGGGHCGLALSRLLDTLGYVVTVVETRGDVFTLRDNEAARRTVVVDDYADGGETIRYPELTHLIVMTADYPSDVRALLGAIELPFPYKGVMGSRAKLRAIRKDLIAEGIDPARFDELYAPIGLDITSNTPEEIAVSVAAQLLKVRPGLFAMNSNGQ